MLGHIMCCEVHRQNEAHLYWHSKAHSTCAVIKMNHTSPGSTSHIQTTCLHPHLSQLVKLFTNHREEAPRTRTANSKSNQLNRQLTSDNYSMLITTLCWQLFDADLIELFAWSRRKIQFLQLFLTFLLLHLPTRFLRNYFIPLLGYNIDTLPLQQQKQQTAIQQ